MSWQGPGAAAHMPPHMNASHPQSSAHYLAELPYSPFVKLVRAWLFAMAGGFPFPCPARTQWCRYSPLRPATNCGSDPSSQRPPHCFRMALLHETAAVDAVQLILSAPDRRTHPRAGFGQLQVQSRANGRHPLALASRFLGLRACSLWTSCGFGM